MPLISLIIWAHDTNLTYFRSCLESIVQQTYERFELYILDESNDGTIERIVGEFFPEDIRVHYRKLKNKKGGAYAANIGSHFATGDYIYYIGQHDTLSSYTLHDIAIRLVKEENPECILYTNTDELMDMDRMNPHFKGGFNKELLMHTPYIGDNFVISNELYKLMGPFQEKATCAYMYEYLLRCCYKNATFIHMPGLLYHKRSEKIRRDKEYRKKKEFCYKEHMAIAQAYLKKYNILGEVVPDNRLGFWNIEYDGSDYMARHKEYTVMRSDDVRIISRKTISKLFGYLKQPDVAVVGIRFMGGLFAYDNVGYIVDKDGMQYPAFHGQRVYQPTYNDLALIPRDVTMVDPSYCLVNKKVLRGLGGIDPHMTPRDAMLDFCLRAKRAGFRTVVVPEVIGRFRTKQVESTESSNARLLERCADMLKEGDLYYDENLPMGINNYVLPGVVEIINNTEDNNE